MEHLLCQAVPGARDPATRVAALGQVCKQQQGAVVCWPGPEPGDGGRGPGSQRSVCGREVVCRAGCAERLQDAARSGPYAGEAGGVLTPEPRLLFETQTALAWGLLRKAGLLLRRVWP